MKLPELRGKTIVRAPTDAVVRLAEHGSFRAEGKDAKLYLTVLAMAKVNGYTVEVPYEVLTTIVSGPLNLEKRRNAEEVFEDDFKRRRGVREAIKRLTQTGLIERLEPTRDVYCFLLERTSLTYDAIPITLWRDGWIAKLTGPELAIYLLLPRFTRSRSGAPGSGAFVRRNLIRAPFTAPILSKALSGLQKKRLLLQVQKGSKVWVALTNPDLEPFA